MEGLQLCEEYVRSIVLEGVQWWGNCSGDETAVVTRLQL